MNNSLPAELEFFTAEEFGSWASRMSPRLLVLLDTFRRQWGAPVRISPAAGALGRRLGPDSASQHNIDRWGEVRAVDIMPTHMSHPTDMRRAVGLAKHLGFSGIGLYPFWRPAPGLHLDVREGRKAGAPALWGAIRQDERQVYVGLQQALEAA